LPAVAAAAAAGARRSTSVSAAPGCIRRQQTLAAGRRIHRDRQAGLRAKCSHAAADKSPRRCGDCCRRRSTDDVRDAEELLVRRAERPAATATSIPQTVRADSRVIRFRTETAASCRWRTSSAASADKRTSAGTPYQPPDEVSRRRSCDEPLGRRSQCATTT